MAQSGALISVGDYHDRAKMILSKSVYEYYARGAGDDGTVEENERAFSRLLLKWRCLRGVEKVNLTTSVLGCAVSSPVCVAPSAMQKLASPDGERSMAHACARAGALTTLSSWSTISMEDVAAIPANGSPRWFQLYVSPDREFTRSIVSRAESSGYQALVLTIDVPRSGVRFSDKRNDFELPPHLSLVHYGSNDVHRSILGGGQANYDACKKHIDRALTGNDIRWLKSITRMPVVVKGVMSCEDAREALRHGADAIWVSNHGGRQLDGTPATIDVLAEVVEAIDGRAEVYMDGGVRSGTDVLKALALGARAVFIGRPPLWGLVCNGAAGAEDVLRILNHELEVSLTLCGCSSVQAVPKSIVVPASRYRSAL